jgi:hypothetical protein
VTVGIRPMASMQIQSTNVRPFDGAAASGLWLVRWLLVLLLIWSQIGASLREHHRHDFGPVSQTVDASLHSGGRAQAFEADDHQHLRIAPAVLSARPQVHLRALAVGGGPGDSGIHSAPMVLTAADGAAPEFEDSDSNEPRQSYRSLPPAGRAPPRHS